MSQIILIGVKVGLVLSFCPRVQKHVEQHWERPSIIQEPDFKMVAAIKHTPQS